MSEDESRILHEWRPRLPDAAKQAQIDILNWAIQVTMSGSSYMMIRQLFAEKIKELEGKT